MHLGVRVRYFDLLALMLRPSLQTYLSRVAFGRCVCLPLEFASGGRLRGVFICRYHLYRCEHIFIRYGFPCHGWLLTLSLSYPRQGRVSVFGRPGGFRLHGEIVDTFGTHCIVCCFPSACFFPFARIVFEGGAWFIVVASSCVYVCSYVFSYIGNGGGAFSPCILCTLSVRPCFLSWGRRVHLRILHLHCVLRVLSC